MAEKKNLNNPNINFDKNNISISPTENARDFFINLNISDQKLLEIHDLALMFAEVVHDAWVLQNDKKYESKNVGSGP